VELNIERTPFQVILISRCKTKQDTQNFFGCMPWTALPHIDSMGTHGQSLMTKFGITSIPALVLLDGNGSVVCLDGRTRITEDPAGKTVTATELADLPPIQGRGLMGARRPRGTPPIFDTAPPIGSAPLTLPLPTRPPTQVPSTARDGEPGRHRPAPSEETPLANLMDVRHPPPKKRLKHKPLPKSNLKAGRGAVSFTHPPGPQPERSTARRTNIQQSADTSYILTRAQLALVAKSTASFSPTASPLGDKTPWPTPVVGHLELYRTHVLLYSTYVLLARPTKVRR
jgi:hypothetical protein